jgi:prepilin-type N-terminal cleavage/methylation domain-containing protein
MRVARAGFSLLEVMVALGILVTTLTILVQSSADSAQMTAEAEVMILGTDLAESVLQDALLRVEYEGFQPGDLHEEGDFSQHGDATIQAEFGETLEEFHWEYWIREIDLAMAGDLAGAAQSVDKSTIYGGGDDVVERGGRSPLEGLGALGFSGEMMSAMLGPYIREVRVRVWWGRDEEVAEERGDEVVITTHVVNPLGALSLEQKLPQ